MYPLPIIDKTINIEWSYLFPIIQMIKYLYATFHSESAA
jgi:hypothetical protein